jgi:ABC-2 type transport system permease protein
MNTLRAALAVETRKARSSIVLRVAAGLVVVGVCGLATMVILAARSGNQELIAKLGPDAATADWPALLATGVQITAAGGLLGFGVGASWLFGREFAEGTVAALFGLPVGRDRIAEAKLVVYAAWAAGVSILLALGLLITGLATGLGPPDTDALTGLARQLALGLLTALIAVPAGWASSWGRGLLPGIAVTIGILVVAQVSVLGGFASWLPIVAPAFWAMQPSASTALTLLTVPLVPLIFGAATVSIWMRLQLDR